jgi:glyoxylase-like metal-dependent hydrolase (beta-lactamase superfamily II)
MQIHIINCGFLNVGSNEMVKPSGPERLQERYPVDRDGNLRLTMNALLVVESDRVIIFDPGCADFLPGRLMETYGLEFGNPIEESLSELGLEVNRVTDVVFTHLHFDHGSGAFQRVPGNIQKRFPEARYHVLKAHYHYAENPHCSESGSFFTKFFRYVDQIYWLEDWKEEWITFPVYHGHTRGMVVPTIHTPGNITYYLTDLVPMRIFLEPDIYSGYDLDPELAMREKQEFINGLPASSRLIFFHDPLENNIYYS